MRHLSNWFSISNYAKGTRNYRDVWSYMTLFEFAAFSVAELLEFLFVRHHNLAKHRRIQGIIKQY